MKWLLILYILNADTEYLGTYDTEALCVEAAVMELDTRKSEWRGSGLSANLRTKKGAWIIRCVRKTP